MKRAISIPIVTYFFLVFIFLSINPWESTIAPMDNLLTNAVWQDVNPFGQEIRNQNRSDVIDSVLPQLRSFRKTPFSKSSIALLISKPLSALYFFNSLESRGLYWMLFFKIFIAGAGMILLLHQLNRSIFAMIFGAITFSFSEFVSSWIYWPHIDVAIWIPWLLFSIIYFYKKPNIVRGIFITVTSYLLTAAWFPSIAAYGFLSAFLVTVVIYWISSKKNLIALLLSNFAMLLGLMIGLLGKSSAISSLGFTTTDISCYNSSVTKDMLSYDISERYNITTALTPQNLFNFFYDSGKDGNPETSVYTGILSIILCFLVLPFLFSYKSKFSKDRIISLILWASLVFTVCIAWGFFPHSFIRLIPTFSFNPWNRLLVISTLLISILSAYSIDYFLLYFRLKKKSILFTILGIVIIGQVYDLQKTWKKYNLSTVHKNYFPITRSISYLQEHSNRYDYVLSDESTYPINGALKNYNLRDWFDHGYRTSYLMAALNNLIPSHENSHSSSRFTVNDISNIKNPLFNYLSVKYIISAHPIHQLTKTYSLFSDKSREKAIQIPQKSSLKIPIYIDSIMTFTAISGEFATYGKPTISSVPISIKIDSKTMNLYKDSIRRLVTLQDNAWKSFRLDQPVTLNGPDTFNITFINHSDTSLALWYGAGDLPRVSLFHPVKDKVWRHSSLEPGIHIYENLEATSGPYLLDEGQKKILSHEITFEHTSDETMIKIEQLEEPGWLVVPDKITRRRTFYDEQNNCLSTSQFMGFLPMTRIERGNTKVIYK